ncbi:uncharacterized protein LOC114951148, partial [Acropora millepora]|uniref:uncharacterized protein LOC114951148 n=1 Tax=Acropora millepora TaxID=45264 RepID=UPI001CF3A434
VQEVPQNKFQGHNLFAGPILHILCCSRGPFLTPVVIQLPNSLGGSVEKFSDPSVCRVRVFFRCSEGETEEWIEISDELESPAVYDGKLVKFKVQHFSEFMFTLQPATGNVSAVSSEITRYLSSITWNLPLVAFFFACFKPGQSLNGHDILFLTCCPAHLREKVKQEHEREHVSYHVVSSDGMMVPDHDKAFVSVWGGIKRPDNLGDMEDFYLRLYRDWQHQKELEVCQASDQAYCGVTFRDKDSNVLATVHLIPPFPTMDSQGAVEGNPARVSSFEVDGSVVEDNASGSRDNGAGEGSKPHEDTTVVVKLGNNERLHFSKDTRRLIPPGRGSRPEDAYDEVNNEGETNPLVASNSNPVTSIQFVPCALRENLSYRWFLLLDEMQFNMNPYISLIIVYGQH